MTCAYPSRYETLTATVEAAAYADGDTFGQKFTFVGALRESPTNGGVLETLTITGLNTSTFDLDVLFFNDDFLAGTDNDPFSTSDADWQDKFIGSVSIVEADWITTANHAAVTKNGVAMVLVAPANGNIYMQLVARGSVTPGTITDYTVKLGILKD